MPILAPEREAPEITFAANAAADASDRLRCDVVVPVSQARAFEMFRHDIYHWWPRDMTWSGDALEHLFLEGRKGGMLWEKGPDGLRLDFARVMRWLPPERFVLRWHVGPGRTPEPDALKASEVELQFFAECEGRTRVGLEHRGFGNHGEGADSYLLRMKSDEGWPRILKCFAEHCEVAENLQKFRAEQDELARTGMS
jgi:hypothetical protein